MNWDFSQFHFIRPLFLFAIPAFFCLWLLMAKAQKTTYWENHLNKQILEALRVTSNKQSSVGRWLLLLAWVITCVAVAGPTWQKQPVPSFQNKSAMVVVLDLSVSMLAEDLTPNRFTQAKYKLIDILRERKDGQTALIVYSGDAHTVTPLTDDPNAIEALLPAVHPDIMPLKGSNTEAAIALATQLLKDSGTTSGEILLMTDGVTESAQKNILAAIDDSQVISVLGVGKSEATPVPLEDGGFLRSSSGEIILSSLDNQQLNQFANKAGGRYSQIRIDNADINYLINDQFSADENQANASAENSTTVYDNWTDMGHWLVLLLLPLAALSFRKGVVYIMPFILPILVPLTAPLLFILPPDANAFEWQDLWSTKDQQAQQLLKENPQAAAEKFNRQDWSGVANYQAEQYANAAKKFAGETDVQSHYNRGNSLAMTGDLEGAIDAYEKAIALDSNYADASHNKKVVEELLKQQEQQDQEGENSDSEQEPSADEDPSESEESSDDSQSQESEEDGEPSEDEEQDSDENSESETEEPSANKEEPSENDEESTESEEEPSADEEDPSADDEEPSADEEPSTEDEEPSANKEDPSITQAEPTPDQLQDSSEQWLRGIQEDPSGLLRRKFEYQTWQRSQQQSNTQSTTTSGDERY